MRFTVGLHPGLLCSYRAFADVLARLEEIEGKGRKRRK